ncbi:hypothetical protein CEXT_601311 [Caerostris extrusa]|uniref:Uncharacterized protein n=1 Tax=Caerostris extrusa TaxID=172846 RepID=A0AAV4MXN1_CAEEX|nr:hypothetical protein CEXT_601311 [Caerostris extrusa]
MTAWKRTLPQPLWQSVSAKARKRPRSEAMAQLNLRRSSPIASSRCHEYFDAFQGGRFVIGNFQLHGFLNRLCCGLSDVPPNQVTSTSVGSTNHGTLE